MKNGLMVGIGNGLLFIEKRLREKFLVAFSRFGYFSAIPFKSKLVDFFYFSHIKFAFSVFFPVFNYPAISFCYQTP